MRQCSACLVYPGEGQTMHQQLLDGNTYVLCVPCNERYKELVNPAREFLNEIHEPTTKPLHF